MLYAVMVGLLDGGGELDGGQWGCRWAVRPQRGCCHDGSGAAWEGEIPCTLGILRAQNSHTRRDSCVKKEK